MEKSALIFLLIVSVVTLGLSFFTAYIYSKFIPMSRRNSRIIRILGVMFPFLYILANGLSRLENLEFVKWIYISMSFGGGVALYLLFGATLIFFVNILFKLFKKNIHKNVPYSILILSLILSFIGFAQSRFIKVNNYDVYIKNLPPGWINKRIVLLSDTHYGLVNSNRASEKTVNKILSLDPSAVFIAGDFFDGPSIKTDEIESHWSRVSDKMPVFFAPGNHEEYGDYLSFSESVKRSGFIFLEDDFTVLDGVYILGFRHRSSKNSNYIDYMLDSYTAINKSLPMIAINHEPIFLENFNKNGIDLLVSGHTHRGQLWPGRYLTLALYGKYHYGLNNYKDMQVLTTSGLGTAGPPMRLFNTPEIVVITFFNR
jgi:predicted MPP superfamily phosphohydrolase